MGNPLTEQIARLIEQMLAENGGELELQRNKLANDVGCVPSQINYVITSRFNADHGYVVESRRGGGGYVRITKVNFDNTETLLMHMLASVGKEVDQMSARAFLVSLFDRGFITEREAKLLYTSLTDKSLAALDKQTRDTLRANLLKSYILILRSSR